MSKVGRNDPCPCGSGKKHKQCCLGQSVPAAPAPPAPDPQFLCLQGDDALERGDLGQAFSCFREAATRKPSLARAHFGMGVVLQQQGRLDEAEQCYLRATSLQKNLAAAYSNLGIISGARWDLAQSVRYLKQALAIDRNFPDAHQNLATTLRNQWRVEESVACLRQALSLVPGDSERHSDLLMTLHYTPLGSAELYREHLAWEKRHGKGGSPAGWPNDAEPERRLRVGFVSADLGRHPISYFLLPLLKGLEKDAFETYCYSDRERAREDDRTVALQEHAAVWRRTAALSDARLAETIRQDKIDILVDLAGHTAKNRLRVFVLKPAPVQVTWLGYPNTTGLSTIDYRITDEIADPPAAEKWHAERLLRVANGFLCYDASAEAPEVEVRTAPEEGGVTFGSLNNLCKVNAEVVQLWSEILRRVPGSRLILKDKGLADQGCRKRVLDAFAAHGIAPHQLELLAFVEGMRDHLALYNRIDIALDTFPYNGTTTTCDALWMGVPVVTLCGERHSARVGASILARVGMDDLVACTGAEYVERAVELARNRERLSGLRKGLRGALASSPLCDAARFGAEVGGALRGAWKEWCGSRQS